jgi:porcupine-like protein
VRLLYSVWHLIIALCFLLLSTCFIEPDILSAFIILPSWFAQFVTALSFRYSHYFVCHFATATAIANGASYSFEIVRWTSIEWPRSMAQVASCWNIQMHVFLHKYFYQQLLSKGYITLSASVITFTISSLLHGIDLRMFAVLLSFGLFSFVEIGLRERLSAILSACIRTRSCPKDGCLHRHKS